MGYDMSECILCSLACFYISLFWFSPWIACSRFLRANPYRTLRRVGNNHRVLTRLLSTKSLPDLSLPGGNTDKGSLPVPRRRVQWSDQVPVRTVLRPASRAREANTVSNPRPALCEVPSSGSRCCDAGTLAVSCTYPPRQLFDFCCVRTIDSGWCSRTPTTHALLLPLPWRPTPVAEWQHGLPGVLLSENERSCPILSTKAASTRSMRGTR